MADYSEFGWPVGIFDPVSRGNSPERWSDAIAVAVADAITNTARARRAQGATP